MPRSPCLVAAQSDQERSSTRRSPLARSELLILLLSAVARERHLLALDHTKLTQRQAVPDLLAFEDDAWVRRGPRRDVGFGAGATDEVGHAKVGADLNAVGRTGC